MFQKIALLILLSLTISTHAQACGGQQCGSHDCDQNRLNFVSKKPKSGNWCIPDFPKSGWACVDVQDLGSRQQRCDMCLREDIRYAHDMIHSDCGGTFKVGCICAGHMEGDLEASKTRQQTLINKSRRQDNWFKRHWKKAPGGNLPYVIFKRQHSPYKALVRIVRSNMDGKYSFFVDSKYNEDAYSQTDLLPRTPRRRQQFYTCLNNTEWYDDVADAQKSAIQTLRYGGYLD